MEITLKKAFYITVKISIQPCLPFYTIVSEIVQQEAYKIVNYLLQKPILTVLIAIVAIIFVMTALAVSFIVMAGITCFVTFFIMVESVFLLICIFMLVNIAAVIILTLIIIYLIKIKSID